MAIAIWFGQRTLRTLREVLLLATVAIFCYLNPVWACPGHFVRTCPRLKAFNKASAYASAVVILVLAFIAGVFYKDFHPRMVGFRVVLGGQ